MRLAVPDYNAADDFFTPEHGQSQDGLDVLQIGGMTHGIGLVFGNFWNLIGLAQADRSANCAPLFNQSFSLDQFDKFLADPIGCYHTQPAVWLVQE